MKDYLSGWPAYITRTFARIDFWLGGLVALLYFNVADQIHLGRHQLTHHRGVVTLVIVIVALVESGYRVYREERDMRSKREQDVRVEAKLVSLSTVFPDPGPDKTSLSVEVEWAVWFKDDVATDKLALNLIYVYDRPWWKFWKKTRFPQIGLPRRGYSNAEYRNQLNPNMLRPYKDSAIFDYITDRPGDKWDPHWLLELVLQTGMPDCTYRVPVFIGLSDRTANPPL